MWQIIDLTTLSDPAINSDDAQRMVLAEKMPSELIWMCQLPWQEFFRYSERDAIIVFFFANVTLQIDFD